MTALIRCEHIYKRFYQGSKTITALHDITFDIQHNEFIAIIGPSGSGKSTLMNILGCLDAPTSGRYFLNGRPVQHLSPTDLARVRNQEIGFVFQQFHLLPYANIVENVALPLVYRGIPVQERRKRAIAMLEQVGLANRLTHKPTELSGGQCQRVAIARALVAEPNLILADEPTGNLDSKTGAEILTLFKQLVAKQNTLIIVTHDLQLAQKAHRQIYIKDGRIVTQPTAE